MFAYLLCSERPLGGDGRCKLCAPEPCITIMLARVYNTPTPCCISTSNPISLDFPLAHAEPEPETPSLPTLDASRPHVPCLNTHSSPLHPHPLSPQLRKIPPYKAARHRRPQLLYSPLAMPGLLLQAPSLCTPIQSPTKWPRGPGNPYKLPSESRPPNPCSLQLHWTRSRPHIHR